MIEKECIRWASKGVNIRYQIRETRGGYKAGALKDGLKHDYVKECEYVAIFDADFRPEPDFLRRAIPFLVHNSNIALVQARWRFGKCPIYTYHNWHETNSYVIINVHNLNPKCRWSS